MYMSVITAFGPGGLTRVQDGVPTIYTDTDFALLVYEGSEIWTSRSLRFVKVGLLQLKHDLGFV